MNLIGVPGLNYIIPTVCEQIMIFYSLNYESGADPGFVNGEFVLKRGKFLGGHAYFKYDHAHFRNTHAVAVVFIALLVDPLVSTSRVRSTSQEPLIRETT